jgi:hypothetical protein
MSRLEIRCRGQIWRPRKQAPIIWTMTRRRLVPTAIGLSAVLAGAVSLWLAYRLSHFQVFSGMGFVMHFSAPSVLASLAGLGLATTGLASLWRGARAP